MDIGSVINHLDIKFGDKVVETGTGSGSLTFSLSQQVGSQGKVFTFEFNKQR
jgi:tRNA (adenine57-N1/adenine58-N1)-methyltransferase